MYNDDYVYFQPIEEQLVPLPDYEQMLKGNKPVLEDKQSLKLFERGGTVKPSPLPNWQQFRIPREDIQRLSQLIAHRNGLAEDPYSGNRNIVVDNRRPYQPIKGEYKESQGYYGPITTDNNSQIRDLPEGTFINDQFTMIPLITPRLSVQDREYIQKNNGLGNDPIINERIRQEAQLYAKMRIDSGMSPFAEHEKGYLKTPDNMATEKNPEIPGQYYVNNGKTSIPEQTTNTENYDKLSFKEAFKRASQEKGRYNTFIWRGKKYLIDYK